MIKILPTIALLLVTFFIIQPYSHAFIEAGDSKAEKTLSKDKNISQIIKISPEQIKKRKENYLREKNERLRQALKKPSKTLREKFPQLESVTFGSERKSQNSTILNKSEETFSYLIYTILIAFIGLFFIRKKVSKKQT